MLFYHLFTTNPYSALHCSNQGRCNSKSVLMVPILGEFETITSPWDLGLYQIRLCPAATRSILSSFGNPNLIDPTMLHGPPTFHRGATRDGLISQKSQSINRLNPVSSKTTVEVCAHKAEPIPVLDKQCCCICGVMLHRACQLWATCPSCVDHCRQQCRTNRFSLATESLSPCISVLASPPE